VISIKTLAISKIDRFFSSFSTFSECKSIKSSLFSFETRRNRKFQATSVQNRGNRKQNMQVSFKTRKLPSVSFVTSLTISPHLYTDSLPPPSLSLTLSKTDVFYVRLQIHRKTITKIPTTPKRKFLLLFFTLIWFFFLIFLNLTTLKIGWT
jgi:hypothetical protein